MSTRGRQRVGSSHSFAFHVPPYHISFPQGTGLFNTHCSTRVDPVSLAVTLGTNLLYGDFCHITCSDGYDMVESKFTSIMQIKHVADYDITNSVGVEDPQYANQACLSVDRCPAMGRCAWCAKSNAGLALGWCLCGPDKHVTCG